MKRAGEVYALRLKKWLIGLLAAGGVLLLSGCFVKTVDELYMLPRHSDAYNHLQEAIDAVKGAGDTFAAPISGVNQQSVQLADLDGDGTEEAVVFLKTGDEKPLKAYIFAASDDAYRMMDVIEGSGTAFESVEYARVTDQDGAVIIIGRQISAELPQALSAYAYRDGHVVELMSANYSEYRVVDLDNNGLSDLFLLRFDAEERSGVAELYRWKNGQIEREPESSLSLGAQSVKRIISGRLRGSVPALFVACTYGENSILTDVFAFRDGVFCNITAADSGMSAQTVRNYYVYASDLDEDGLIEIPDPVALPSADPSGEPFSKIIWYNLDLNGRRTERMTTYHNFQGGWYLVLPAELQQTLAIRRSEEVSGVRGYEFSEWSGTSSPKPLFVIHAFSGENRDTLASMDGRFILAKKGDMTYSALLTEEGEKNGFSEQSLAEMFHFIRIDWNSGET